MDCFGNHSCLLTWAEHSQDPHETSRKCWPCRSQCHLPLCSLLSQLCPARDWPCRREERAPTGGRGGILREDTVQGDETSSTKISLLKLSTWRSCRTACTVQATTRLCVYVASWQCLVRGGIGHHAERISQRAPAGVGGDVKEDETHAR